MAANDSTYAVKSHPIYILLANSLGVCWQKTCAKNYALSFLHSSLPRVPFIKLFTLTVHFLFPIHFSIISFTCPRWKVPSHLIVSVFAVHPSNISPSLGVIPKLYISPIYPVSHDKLNYPIPSATSLHLVWANPILPIWVPKKNPSVPFASLVLFSPL